MTITQSLEPTLGVIRHENPCSLMRQKTLASRAIKAGVSDITQASGGHMKRLSLYATVLALFAGTAGMLQHSRTNRLPEMHDETGLNNSAAFRDGLYLG